MTSRLDHGNGKSLHGELSGPTPRRLTPPLGALLAGGASRRMGRPKASCDLGGRPLSAWAAATLTSVTERAYQVGGDRIAGLGLPHLVDRRAHAGPAAGIEAALQEAGGAAVVVVALDLPFAPPALLRCALARVRAGALAAAPRTGGRWHPLCAAYSPAVLAALRRRLDAGALDLCGLLDDVGAVALGESVVAAFGPPADVLTNVNDGDDLDAARRYLRG